MSNISLNTPLLLPHAGQSATTSGTGGLSPELLSQSPDGFALSPCSTPFTSSWRASSRAPVCAESRASCSESRQTGCPVSSPLRWRSSSGPSPQHARTADGRDERSGSASKSSAATASRSPSTSSRTRLNMNGWIGLSWVAVWTLLFTVVIPDASAQGARGHARVGQLRFPSSSASWSLTHRTTFSPDAAAVLLLDRLSVSAVHDDGVCGRARRLLAGESGDAKRVSSEAIVSWSVWVRAAWERSGGHSIACWRARRQSSSYERRRRQCRRFGRGGSAIRAGSAGDRAASHRLIPCSSSTSVSPTTAGSIT